MYRNFEEIAQEVKTRPKQSILAVAGAADPAVLDSVLQAGRDGIIRPILVGDAGKIKTLLSDMDAGAELEIINAPQGKEGQYAVDLVRHGEADVLMKGMIDTRDILQPVVKKENGLRTGAIMSHVVFFDRIPKYGKLLVQTDGGMVMYPTLEEKKAIIENAVNTLHAMGYDCPKVAVLAAIEKVNPKMVESVEADALKTMNRNGQLPGCVVEGPISYDVAMSAEIAAHKRFDCPYCGDFDILVVPNMSAGNILGKCWTVTCGAMMGGIIVGARAPIVMTSRGSSAEEKYYSIAIAALSAMGSN